MELEYTPGELFALIRPNHVVLLPADADRAQVQHLWAVAARPDATVGSLLSALMTAAELQIDRMPPFAVVSRERAPHVVVRGGFLLHAVSHAGAGETTEDASGEDVATWQERRFRPADSWNLAPIPGAPGGVGDGSGAADWWPISEGIVRVGSLRTATPGQGAPTTASEAATADVAPVMTSTGAESTGAESAGAESTGAESNAAPEAAEVEPTGAESNAAPETAEAEPEPVSSPEPVFAPEEPETRVGDESSVPDDHPMAPDDQPSAVAVAEAAAADADHDDTILSPSAAAATSGSGSITESKEGAESSGRAGSSARGHADTRVEVPGVPSTPPTAPPWARPDSPRPEPAESASARSRTPGAASRAPEAGLIDSVPWRTGPQPGAAASSTPPSRPAPPTPRPAPTAEESAAKEPAEGPADADHDGETIMRSSIAEPAPAANSSATDDGLTLTSHGTVTGANAGQFVLGRACAEGHANPPTSSNCFVCGAQLSGDAHQVLRPALGRMTVNDGAHESVHELTRSVVVGRQPAYRGKSEPTPRLMQVNSPSGDISRSHVQVRVEGWHVELVDLAATNGTVLVRSGHPPRRLGRDESVLLLSGDIADLGDGVSLRFEDLP
ncbi:hypothetical protein GCM10022377_13210 [Zhihengliuella alba]|uniref:FHA domain-containing protein n=1 Tax=Zhihengliuella alba TaxID=547018 RepID=A0ABP7D979_9MICC